MSISHRLALNRRKTPGSLPAFAKDRAVQACVASADTPEGLHGGSSPVALMHRLPKRAMWSDLSDGLPAFAGSPPRRDPLWRVSRSRSRGRCLFSSANSAVWETHGRASRPPPVGPHGLSTCGGVVEWSGFLPRFPELVSQESLGVLGLSTGCPHRAFCSLGASQLRVRIGFPGRGVAENSQGELRVKKKRRGVCAFVTVY